MKKLILTHIVFEKEFKSMHEFKTELDKYINWYNNKRIKTKLKAMSPVKYRTHYVENL